MSGSDIANLIIGGATGLGMISVILYLGAVAIIKSQKVAAR